MLFLPSLLLKICLKESFQKFQSALRGIIYCHYNDSKEHPDRFYCYIMKFQTKITITHNLNQSKHYVATNNPTWFCFNLASRCWAKAWVIHEPKNSIGTQMVLNHSKSIWQNHLNLWIWYLLNATFQIWQCDSSIIQFLRQIVNNGFFQMPKITFEDNVTH